MVKQPELKQYKKGSLYVYSVEKGFMMRDLSKKTRPNEFGSMTARKDNTGLNRSIQVHTLP